jgi:hypothetical protein
MNRLSIVLVIISFLTLSCLDESNNQHKVILSFYNKGVQINSPDSSSIVSDSTSYSKNGNGNFFYYLRDTILECKFLVQLQNLLHNDFQYSEKCDRECLEQIVESFRVLGNDIKSWEVKTRIDSTSYLVMTDIFENNIVVIQLKNILITFYFEKNECKNSDYCLKIINSLKIVD